MVVKIINESNRNKSDVMMYSDDSLKVYTFFPARKYLNRSLYVSFYKNMSADTEIATEISK